MKRPKLEDYKPSEINDGQDMADWYETYSKALEKYVEHLEQMNSSNDIHNVSGCPYEAYAVFCIECDRQGIKPVKHKDFLALG